MRIRLLPFIQLVWQRIHSRLLYKMIIIYTLLTVIPLAIVSTTFYIRSKNVLETKLLESRNQAMVETTDKIDAILKSFSDLVGNLADNPVLLTLMRNDYQPAAYPLERSERQTFETTLTAILNFEKNADETTNRYIDAIYVYNKESLLYNSDDAPPPQHFLAMTYLPLSKDGKPEWAFFTDRNRFICIYEVMDRTFGTTLGYIAIMLNPEAVSALYSTYPTGTFFITNDRGMILSTDQEERLGTLFDTRSSPDLVVNKRHSNYSGFVYANVIKRSELYQEINRLGTFATVTTIVSWILMLLLTFILLNRITRPLQKLTLLMRKAGKERFEPIRNIKSNDEVGVLSHSFNQLIAEIEDLLKKVYKAEIYKKEAEINAIKMHMNPHFLYNTLEAIGILVKSRQHIDAVPEMIHMLSRILRFSITPGNDYIPLQIELQFAEWYIRLHQFRLGERLSYRIDVPDELMRVKVPKLILQTLVENAIIHGVGGTDKRGMIRISAREADYDLALEVSDNGPGMLAKSNVPNEEKTGTGTGLIQLETRIRLLFGERYGLSVAKSGREGTTIRLTLPLTFNEE